MKLLRMVAVALALATVASGCVWRVVASVDIAGNEATASVLLRGFSEDGRYVLLLTAAQLDPLNDTNADNDLYRRDLLTGQTRLVSVVDGTNTAPLDSGVRSAAISADGRHVAFESDGSHVAGVPGAANMTEVYRRDMNATTVDHVGTPGVIANAVDIDDSGDFVSYWESSEMHVENVATGTRVSSGVSGFGVMAGDASAVYFDSVLALVPADTNTAVDVYRWDVQAGTFSLVTVNEFGTVGALESRREDISGDGRRVLFRTASANMVLGDTNGVDDLFVKDIVTGSISRVTVDDTGAEFPDAPISLGGGSSIDGDGASAVFRMPATSGPSTLYRHRVASGATLDITPDVFVQGASEPDLSGDGNYLAYVEGGQVYVQFLESPVVDSVTPATVPVGATTSVTIEGSGYLNDANVYLTGRPGVSVSNVVMVDFSTIAADVTVEPTANPGDLWVNVETIGTGPGAATGAFGNCGTCLSVS